MTGSIAVSTTASAPPPPRGDDDEGDRYDRIYAKYFDDGPSSFVGSIEEVKSIEVVAATTATGGAAPMEPHGGEVLVVVAADPVGVACDESPTISTTKSGAKKVVDKRRTVASTDPPEEGTTRYYYADVTQAAAAAAASRDDDVSASSGRRGGGRWSRGVGGHASRQESSPIQQQQEEEHRSRSSPISQRRTREEMYDRLGALNARSQALRGMTRGGSASGSVGGSSRDNFQSSGVKGDRRSRMDELDDRLEYLTRRSAMLRDRVNDASAAGGGGGGGVATTGGGNGDVVSVPSPSTRDGRTPSSVGGNNEAASVMSWTSHGTSSTARRRVKFVDDFVGDRSVTGAAAAAGAANARGGGGASILNGGGGASNGVVVASSTPRSKDASRIASSDKSEKATSSSPSSLALRVLSEKILDGHAMTRERCPKCGMAMLSHPSSNNKKAAECAVCPVNELRELLSSGTGISNAVVGSLLLSGGLEVASATSSSPGAAAVDLLCPSCNSPTLMDPNTGTPLSSCRVCPILDDACVRMVREEGRTGGKVRTYSRCASCMSPELMIRDGATGVNVTRCVVCPLLEAGADDDAAERWRRLRQQERGPEVAGGGSASPGALPRAPSFASQPPALATSNSIKSPNPPPPPHSPAGDDAGVSDGDDDLVQLQERVVAELTRARVAQESLANALRMPSLGRRGTAEEQESSAANNDGRREILKSASIASVGDFGGPDLARLRDQLNEELARARESQATLEQTLLGGGGGSFLDVPNDAALREELERELAKTKEAQASLERILQDADAIADEAGRACPPPSISPSSSQVPEPAQSFSISQQEVDNTGHLKEYIPPAPAYPLYFFNDNIPSVVTVYHYYDVNEDNNEGYSVAAQSHHLNLKRSERDVGSRRRSGSVFDCCGAGGGGGVLDHRGNDRHGRRRGNNDRHDDDFDHDTIETDDEYTIDYTLNTVDDSRLEYLRSMRDDEDNYRRRGSTRADDDDDEDDESRYHSVHERRGRSGGGMPKSAIGRFLHALFGVCGPEESDAYSMVSRRGIMLNHRDHGGDDRHQHNHHPVDRHRSDQHHPRRWRDEQESVVYETDQLLRQYRLENLTHGGHGERSSKYPAQLYLSSSASMDYSDGMPQMLPLHNGNNNRGAPSESNLVLRPTVSQEEENRTRTPSPPTALKPGIADSPKSGLTDMDSTCRVGFSPPSSSSGWRKSILHPPSSPVGAPRHQPSQQFRQQYRQNYSSSGRSVQSDLTDLSSVNHRRVTFGGKQRQGQPLQALTEESMGSGVDRIGRSSESNPRHRY